MIKVESKVSKRTRRLASTERIFSMLNPLIFSLDYLTIEGTRNLKAGGTLLNVRVTETKVRLPAQPVQFNSTFLILQIDCWLNVRFFGQRVLDTNVSIALDFENEHGDELARSCFVSPMMMSR